MSRRVPYLLAISVAAVSFSAAPAMATDQPAPPAAAPPAAGVPLTTGPVGTCADQSAPSAHLSSTSRGASRTKLLRGSSTDRGCETGGAGKVAAVSVSVALKSGRHCEFLSRSHRLGRSTSCAKPHWLSASGTASWKLRLPKHLKHGRYQVTVRAVDSAGNVAPPSSRPLRIR